MQTYNSNIQTQSAQPAKKENTPASKKRKKINRQDWEDWLDGFSNMLAAKTLST